MKRVIFISAMLYATLGVFAQTATFDRNIGIFTSAITAKPGFNGGWLIGGWSGNGTCVGGLLFGADSTGNDFYLNGGHLFNSGNVYYGNTNAMYLSDIDTFMGNTYVIGDGQIILAKTESGSAGGGIILERFNSSGAFIDGGSYGTGGGISVNDTLLPTIDAAYFQHPTDSSQFYNYFDRQQLAVRDANNVFVSIGDYLSLINPSNQYSISWTKHFSGYINDLLYSNNYLYLATDSGLIQADVNGNQLRNLVTTGWATAGFKTQTGKVYFTDQQKIFETDTLLNITASYRLTDSLSSWTVLSGNGNKLVLLGRKATDSSFVVAVLDSGLTQFNTFPLASSCGHPVTIAANDNYILVASEYSPLPANVGMSQYTRSIDGFGPTQFVSNIEVEYATYTYAGASYTPSVSASVTSATIDSSSFRRQNSCYQCEPFIDYFNLVVKLTNTGTDTIHTIFLTSDILDALNNQDPDHYNIPGCTNDPGYAYDTNLMVLPGDTFTIPDLKMTVFDSTTIYPSIYVNSINGQPVNHGCDTNRYHVAFAIFFADINTPTTPKFTISPNPTDGVLNVHSDIPSAGLFALYDLSGKLLFEQNLANTNEQFDIHGLAKGMYIYSVRSTNQMPVTGKLVKE